MTLIRRLGMLNKIPFDSETQQNFYNQHYILTKDNKIM